VVKRIIIPAVLFAALLLGGSGCMRKNPTQNINAVALAYMEQRYGEKFEYVAPWGNSMSGTHELFVKCESLPEQKILVQIENYKKTDKVFRDNYLAVEYREDTVAFFKNCVEQIFGEAKVFYDVATVGLSSELSANATFDEYFVDSSGFISIYIVVKASSFITKEQFQNVTEPILSTCKVGHLNLILAAVDDSEYAELTDDALKEQVVSRKFVRCARLTKEGGIVRIEWLGED
jgi:hypothetical protein